MAIPSGLQFLNKTINGGLSFTGDILFDVDYATGSCNCFVPLV
jgi:hypothetical protein